MNIHYFVHGKREDCSSIVPQTENKNTSIV